MITKIRDKYTNILRFQMQGTLLLSWGIDMIDTEVTQKGLHLIEAEEPLETGHVYTHTHTHMHAQTHTRTHAYMHARAHTHSILSLPLLIHLYIHVYIIRVWMKAWLFLQRKKNPSNKQTNKPKKGTHKKVVNKTLKNSSCLRIRSKC